MKLVLSALAFGAVNMILFGNPFQALALATFWALPDEPKQSRKAPYPSIDQAAQSWRHSLRAAARLSLNVGLDERCRSWLKWLWIEPWTAANF